MWNLKNLFQWEYLANNIKKGVLQMKICFLDAKTMGNDIDLNALTQFGDFSQYETTKPEEVYERSKDCEIIIANKVIFQKDLLSKLKKLKIICLTATGYNTVDVKVAKELGIAVCNVSGYSTTGVVQHTFSLALSLLSSVAQYDEFVKSGEYAKSDIFCHYGPTIHELAGMTWGIIGLGEIGRGVARVAEAFGCRIIYYSTSGGNNNSSYEKVELDQLLSNADIVSIHCPLNDKTKGLIDYKKISMMKKSSILLNLGRGGILNETDLVRALKEGLIKGAGLDVLQVEPLPEDSPLLEIKDSGRLVITPHVAWASFESRTRLINEVCENIISFLKGEKRNRVD